MSAPLAEGEILAGKYRVDRVLGQGGMGVVLLATHLQLDQRVAVKLLLEGASADVTARFLREARAAVKLKSEHVARVIDVGELPSGAPFMVMEFLDGQDLSQLVRGYGPRAIPEAVDYLLHACEAIAEAHANGIIHRDLKPANLFLTRAADGTSTVKVLDFGISKMVETGGEADGGMALTKTSTVLGSPLYMSPEQMKSARQADARSDIWSLGAILYELLVGVVPFNTQTFTELVLMVNMSSPPPMTVLRPDVPPPLEAAILRCLEKNPDKRFQNVADLAWAIAPFGGEHAQASAARAARTLQAAGVATAGPQTTRPGAVMGETNAALAGSSATAPGSASGGRGKILAGGAIVAVAAAAAFFAFGRRPAPMPAADPTPVASVSAPGSASAATTAPIVAPAEPAASASAAPTATASAATTAAPRPLAPARQPPTAAPPTSKKNPLQIELK